MSGDVSWQLNGTQGKLQCGELTALLDARSPNRGLHDVRLAGRLLADCSLLAIGVDVNAADSLGDLYQRGGDFIVRYSQTPQRAFAVQVYWRAGLAQLGGAPCPYCDLLVSVETQLLDSRPLLEARTWLSPAGIEDIVQRPNYCIVRLADAPVSYVELCQPADALDQEPRADRRGVRLATRLFGQPLEKGVILRSRVRGLFVARADDESIARAALDEFASQPPPLTT